MNNRQFPCLSALLRSVVYTSRPLAWQGAVSAAGLATFGLFVSAFPTSAQSQSLVKPGSPDSISNRFGRPWHVEQPRPIVVAAWQSLKQLEVPDVALDQHFTLKGSVFYVGPNGDDTATGSREHPWRTLRHAATQLSPGTVIYLLPGTYYGPVEIRTKATEQSPAALRAVAGQEVVVTYDDGFIRQQQARIARPGKEGALDANGKELHYPSLITIVGSCVEVSGLHLVGIRDRLPMNLYSESGISFAGGGGLGCRVLYNEIENTGHCGVKEMGHGGKGFLIEGNYIHDLGLTAHDHAIYLPADDVTVRRNLLLNAAGWGVHAYTEPKRLTISHNVIGGNAEDAVILGGADCRVLNNVLYRDRRGGVFLFRRGCRNNTVANNIILEPTAFRFDSAGSDAPADQPQGNVLDYNCIPSPSSAVSRFNPLGVHNIRSEPALVDASRLDFRLQPGSPCIDAGDPKLVTHYYGHAPNIGLYETGGPRIYSTRFEGIESPLSEGGVWSNNGIDWNQIRKKNGIAFGTQTGTNTGISRFDDSYAHLSGFPPDQEAWGEARILKPNASCNQELEILLRFTSAPHRTTGYECFARCVNSPASYLQIVRWEGPLGKFTYLADKRGTNYGLNDGDILKASIVGDVITVSINGVEKARATDDTFKTGNPGIGEFLACESGQGIGSNSDFGFASFTARGIPRTNTNAISFGGQAPIQRPLRASVNPNYFADSSGSPLILCGSQTWNTLQDWGTAGSVQPLDFDAFVTFLRKHGHNFTLLWHTELPKFSNLPVTATHSPDFTVSPHPWLRTGPGLATDGGLKFDLTQFDPAYFDRLRTRVDTLNRAGIYAGVYLFTGEWLLRFRSPTDGYPFSGPNNINGVDDGYRGGPAESGLASVTMMTINTITEVQDAYVRKTVDTLNDLPNVLWVVSEEAPRQSTWWNGHLVSLVKNYERTKPYQHPVGYAALESPPDSVLYNSDADWVAPCARISPTTSSGTGQPPCKVNINDSDHSYFGMWNDTPQKNRNYAWQNFLNGNQVLFMDPYLVYYPRENRNLCLSPVNGIGSRPDPRWDNFRNSLGYLLRYSRKLNLAYVTSRNSLCSTGFCLAQTPPVGAEYLAYAPDGGAFTMDLSAMSTSRRLSVEWFDPAAGATITENPIVAGSSSQPFSPPFRGDAVLYLVDTAGHK